MPNNDKKRRRGFVKISKSVTHDCVCVRARVICVRVCARSRRGRCAREGGHSWFYYTYVVKTANADFACATIHHLSRSRSFTHTQHTNAREHTHTHAPDACCNLRNMCISASFKHSFACLHLHTHTHTHMQTQPIFTCEYSAG